MAYDTQNGKKGKGGPRTGRNKTEPTPGPSEPPRSQQAKEWLRSVGRKGTHDAAADLIKRVLLWGGASIVIMIVALSFGVDLRPWFKWVHYPPLETGSTNKLPARQPATMDLDAVNKAIACRLRQEREIDRLVERRKAAWGVYDKCKTDWKPTWSDKRTADEVCTPQLAFYRQASQDVKDRQAKDECSTEGTK